MYMTKTGKNNSRVGLLRTRGFFASDQNPARFLPLNYSARIVKTAISGGTRNRNGKTLVPMPVVTNIS